MSTRTLLSLLALPLLGAAACAELDPPATQPSPAPTMASSSPPAAPPAPPPPAPLPPEGQARAFVAAVAAQHFAEAAQSFDAVLTMSMPPAALADLWARLEDAGGPFQAIESTESDVDAGYRVVRVTARFAHLRKVLRFVVGEDGRIVGLFFGPVPREVEDQARAVVDRLSHGDYAGAGSGFDSIMRASLPPDKLEAVWKQVVKKAGRFSAVQRAAVVPAGSVWTVLLTCRFGTAELLVKVAFDIRDQVAGLFFLPGDSLAPWKAPAYAQPDRFTEREVSLGSSPALPGTLTLPRGAGPFPVVVLVHGSGPNDADESIGPSKIFKDIAWGLASRGVAALRYVKRTRHAPAGVVSVKEEVLDGAAAAIDLALHTRELDPRRVVVAGHSQGGYLAPRIAADNAAVAGIVLLAGPSRPLQDSIVEQLVYLQQQDPGDAAKKRLVLAARAFKTRVEDPALGPDEPIDVPGGGALSGRYFLSLRSYRPTEVAARLTIPILLLQGARDYQVTAPDFDGWKRALGGRPGVVLKQYPGLNHLFITGTGTPRPAEYETPGHVDAAVIDDLVAFVGRLSAP
jgi:uncharacterized protein